MKNSRSIIHPTPAPDGRGRAFSLVELVIVVVIIGIIAAIAVPRIGRSAEGATESALVASLTSMRNAIDRYAAEHNGEHPGPTAVAFEGQLLTYSNAAGQTAASGGSSHPLGPYLRSIPPVPVGPNAGQKTVAIDASNSPPLVTGGAEAWVYNPNTGEILANTDDANSEGTLTYDQY